MAPTSVLTLVAWSDTVNIIRYVMRPEIIFLLIPIVAIIMGGLIGITKLVLRHRERIAKIEMGIDPDAPLPTKDDGQNNR